MRSPLEGEFILQLLTFSKGGVPVKIVQPLFPFIEENARFSLCGSNCEIVCRVQDNLWACEIDKNQIGQVIDNIVINAKQAMLNGGQVEIIAKNIVVQKSTHDVLQPGKIRENFSSGQWPGNTSCDSQ